MSLAPVYIHWCIMFWTRGDPLKDIGDAEADSLVGRDVLQWLIDEQLISWSESERRYVAQERLGVFVAHLCEQPIPVQKWVIPTEPKQ